jgi:hypothetical protein
MYLRRMVLQKQATQEEFSIAVTTSLQGRKWESHM